MKKTLVLFFVLAFVCLTAVSYAGKVPTKGYVNADIGLNIRKGPGTGYAVVIAVENKTNLTILEVKGSWYKVQVGSTVGYASSAYIVVTDSRDSDDANLPPAEAEKVGRDIARSAINASITTVPAEIENK